MNGTVHRKMFRRKRNSNHENSSPETDSALRNERAWRWVFVGMTFVILFILISPIMGVDPLMPTGEEKYAQTSYIADVPFESRDISATNDAQQNAAQYVARIYVHDRAEIDKLLQRTQDLFAQIQARATQRVLSKEDQLKLLINVDKVPLPPETLELLLTLTPSAEAQLRASAEVKTDIEQDTDHAADAENDETVDTGVTNQDGLRPLSDLKYFARVRDVSLRVLRNLLEEGILKDGTDEPAGIVIVEPDEPDNSRIVATEKKLWQESVSGRLGALIKEEFTDDEQEEAAKLERAVYSAVMSAKPDETVTLVKDETLTEEVIEEAKSAVEPVFRTFSPGQIIVRKGDTLSTQALVDLKAWSDTRTTRSQFQNRLTALMGNALLLLFALGTLWWFLIRHLQETGTLENKLILVTLLVVVFEIGLARAFSVYDRSGYLVPVASGVILVAILVDRPVALMVALFTCVLAGRIHGNAYHILVTLLGGSLAGLFSIRQVRRRSDIVKAAIVVTAASVVLVIAMNLLSNLVLWDESLSMWSQPMLANIGREVVHAGLNGAMVLGIVFSALPFLESVFKLVTDVTLLEYSDLDHPLLQRMLTEAPGTYHHSMVVGLLAQSAADAIGANSVLARVASYYHDIGKLEKPLYFSENQEGENKHDELSPTMSSRIVTSHVKKGLLLADEYRLPQPIRDIIVQHHGTNHVSFFYQKAVERAQEGSVREQDFRYPGPRPQSREAAIVMLADSIESTSRSLTNATPARIRNVADRIINQRFSDGQFDECDLTLRDLHTLADVITKAIVKMQHGRIAYPGTEQLAGPAQEETQELDTAPVTAGSN